ASATSRWTSAAGTSAGGTRCRWAGRSGSGSSRPPRHEEGLEPVHRGLELVALDGAGRVDVLGTGPRALADKGAAPDALVLGQDLPALLRPLVARVEVIALGQRDRRRADELRLQAVDRAGGVAQQAVDAHAVLLVLVHLLGRLAVLALGQWLLLLADDPR